jgi:hypothetical protein
MLLHDNAHAHSAIRVRQLLAQRAVSVVDHPPHSPDQAPVDCFLFPRLKSNMNGAGFPDMAAIQGRVTAVLRLNAKRAFADSFQQLHERCQKCVVMNGDYCKGQ